MTAAKEEGEARAWPQRKSLRADDESTVSVSKNRNDIREHDSLGDSDAQRPTGLGAGETLPDLPPLLPPCPPPQQLLSRHLSPAEETE